MYFINLQALARSDAPESAAMAVGELSASINFANKNLINDEKLVISSNEKEAFGSLAGLVGITAGADVVSVMSSIIIGLIAGMIVVASAVALDKLKLDDCVGAVSVHLTCGIWGTLLEP